MDIKKIVKNTIENWINNELDIDPRGCMAFLYEPERPTTEPEKIKE